jgi:pyruvate dehydrogenase E1 component alpha subunit
MMGRSSGISNGLGGAMQLFDAENRFYSGSVVGSGVAIAPGIALAMREQSSDNVCMCIFGDGATNTGSFHEGLNLAAIWELPVIFVCENNHFAEAMPAREFIACERISQRAAAYGLPEIRVDGNDVAATRQAADRAVAQCRAGEGPVFIEAVTYRIRGHYVGDPEDTYRSNQEVEEWKARCPIKQSRVRLESFGVEEEEFKCIEANVAAELDSARQWAMGQPFPTVDQAVEHVLAP